MRQASDLGRSGHGQVEIEPPRVGASKKSPPPGLLPLLRKLQAISRALAKLTKNLTKQTVSGHWRTGADEGQPPVVSHARPNDGTPGITTRAAAPIFFSDSPRQWAEARWRRTCGLRRGFGEGTAGACSYRCLGSGHRSAANLICIGCVSADQGGAAGEVMSWLSSAWDWYAIHSDKVNPIVAGLGGAALVWAAI